jgi:hypothetical protein
MGIFYEVTLFIKICTRCIKPVVCLVFEGSAPQIDAPSQVVSAPNKDAALDCVVHSQLHYSVTWARAPLDAVTGPMIGKCVTLILNAILTKVTRVRAPLDTINVSNIINL